MTGFPILSLMLLVPLVGAGLVLKANREQARLIALIATLIDFVLGIVLWMHFDVGGAQWQFQERAALFSGFE